MQCDRYQVFLTQEWVLTVVYIFVVVSFSAALDAMHHAPDRVMFVERYSLVTFCHGIFGVFTYCIQREGGERGGVDHALCTAIAVLRLLRKVVHAWVATT